MAKKPSQVVSLLLSQAEALGIRSDKDLATLAGVSVETVGNWRAGTVQELKSQKLAAIQTGLAARATQLLQQASATAIDPQLGLCQIEIESGSNPADLQRQFRNQVHYDYLGHRFLYFDPQGALAWENLIRQGYGQDRWLDGVRDLAKKWLDTTKTPRGQCKGEIANALGLARKARPRGVDVVSLGPGEGGKELAILDAINRAAPDLPWVTLAEVDVSIPLLLTAATTARSMVRERNMQNTDVLAFCADFEEGSLAFLKRLPTENHEPDAGTRLIAILGNVFGNVRSEESFVRDRLGTIARPGDLVWFEVGARPNSIHDDPLYRLVERKHEESAAETNRRLLLEGPYRRWESALGRAPAELEMRVSMHEDDDTARIPGSINFCHDLYFKNERRACTMLYSRRYDVSKLVLWLERMGMRVLDRANITDGKGNTTVSHILALKK